jgi:heat shock protein HslJ
VQNLGWTGLDLGQSTCWDFFESMANHTIKRNCTLLVERVQINWFNKEIYPMKKKITLTIISLFVALLAACSSGLPKEMLDTTWEWQQLIETAPASQSVILHSENYIIVFNQDGTYNAKADCNFLTGGYEVSGSDLTLLPGPTTLAECGPESSYDQYVGLLAQVDGYELENEKLILTYGDGAGQMIFANAGPAE